MAGPGVSSPGGFSYAQAAKGRAPTAASAKAVSSEGASGAATPANGILAELASGSGGNWADDVELSVGDKQSKPQEEQEEQKEQSKPVEAKGAVERAKSEEKAVNGSSGVSSPDMAASATSNDDSVTGQNGSSHTSWEGKSQTSEPAQQAEPSLASGSWITARAERQSSSKNDTPTRGGKRGKGERAEKHEKAEKTEKVEEPAPKPVVLTEAPQPTFNPWAKRAEDTKARMAAIQQASPKPTSSPTASGSTNMKENQAPRGDSKKKSNSVAGLTNGVQPTSNGDAKKPNSSQGRRTEEVRITPQQKSKPAPSTPHAEVQTMNYAKPSREERQSLSNLTATTSTVKDEVSWPTPDTAPAPAQEKSRKPVTEKDAEEKEDDGASTGKPRKKQEWKPVPVVPNILWETPGMSEKTAGRGGFGGEGRGRGGARGRGGPRGAPNGVSVGDRSAARTGGQNGDDAVARRNTADAINEAASTASLMQRAPSASSWTESKGKMYGTNEAATDEVKQVTSERRTKSPKKTESTTENGVDEERVPQPIPRRTSQGTQTESQVNGITPSMRDGAPIRMVPSESRKESRNGENGSWAVNGSGRGAKRGGRGRGGSREYVNGHHSAHSFANGGIAPEYAAASPFGVPQSPSFPSRGNHAFPGSARGNWRGGNPRATSIPMDGFYARYSGYPTPVQPFTPEMYAFQGYPMAAQPYNPMMDTNYLFACVGMQIEYYFSIDNLLKDMFLRKNMDSQGFVYLDVIGSFNRIKQVTQDRDLLKQVCLQHECVEIRVGEDGKERLRKVRGWEQFVLPMDERFPSAKTEGPAKLERPEQRMPNMYVPYQMNPHGGANFMPARPNDRRSLDQYAMMNGAARGAFFPESLSGPHGEMPNGEEMRGRATRSPIHEGNMNSQAVLGNGVDPDAEPDVFPEQSLEQLTVCVRLSARRAPYHTAASRTFSNGSIDSRSISSEMEKQNAAQAKPASDGERMTNGINGSGESQATSPTTATSPERNASELSVFWVKDTDNPSGTLPNDLTPEPYVHLRYKALEQRSHAATGTCPYDLDVLYQFWSHFLIRNFNNRMYTEFKFYAEADAKERHSPSGKQNLIKYYGQALASASVIPTRVLKDYIETAKADAAQDDGTAFKQLRQAWRNGALNLRNRKKLADTIDYTFKAQLEA